MKVRVIPAIAQPRCIAGDYYDETAAIAQDATHLPQTFQRIFNVFQGMVRDHQIETAVFQFTKRPLHSKAFRGRDARRMRI